MAASAAYWIASAASELVVIPSGQVGSVGVYALHLDRSALNEKMGVLPTYISAGKFKVEGNPDEPLSDDARAAFQQTVDEFYGMFVSRVAKSRGVKKSQVVNGFGEGRVVTASRALEEGMVDRIDTLDQVLDKLQKPARGNGRASVAMARRRLEIL